jgi:hypothetical protein
LTTLDELVGPTEEDDVEVPEELVELDDEPVDNS